MSVTLGSREKPVKVACDNVSAKPRFIYGALDEEDCRKVREREHRELDTVTFAGYKGSSIAGTTCKMRFAHGTEPWLSLEGSKIVVQATVGNFRRGRRGCVVVDLLVANLRIVRRPWYWLCT